jgi:hypothetical protein
MTEAGWNIANASWNKYPAHWEKFMKKPLHLQGFGG